MGQQQITAELQQGKMSSGRDEKRLERGLAVGG